jgi:hypothetical protein
MPAATALCRALAGAAGADDCRHHAAIESASFEQQPAFMIENELAIPRGAR